MNSITIVNHHTVFIDITEKAKEILASGLFEIFTITESKKTIKIQDAEQLSIWLERGYDIFICGGTCNELKHSITWTVDDIIEVAESEISKQEATIILDNLIANHDANVGINWDCVHQAINNYLTSKIY